MTSLKWKRAMAGLIALGLVAAACGSDSDGESTSSDGASTGGDSDSGGETADGNSLVGICPDPLIVQTDWFPEAEHGYTYNLIGPDGELDADAGVYSGPLGDTGITMEVRAGGPYIGFSPPVAQFYSDADIFMAYVSTDSALTSSATLPVTAVFAPFEVGPQILMWNPEVYDFETFEDIGASGAPVLYFEGGAYMTHLLGNGILTEAQVDASYDGSPARFLTEDVVQQGFASAEPWKYENTIEDWMKPVEFLLIHDSGFETYEGALSVKPESITEDAACLEKLVPMFQQSQVDYMTNPEAMNIRLDQIIKDLDSFWTSSPEGNAAGTASMKDLGLVSDGSDSTVGNMDADRIQKLIDGYLPFLEADGIDTFEPDLKAEDIFTNQFIDESIGLGY